MKEKVSVEIYQHPEVVKAMERCATKSFNEDGDGVDWAVFIRAGWKPGDIPTIFVNDARPLGCIEIYNPDDGRIFE